MYGGPLAGWSLTTNKKENKMNNTRYDVSTLLVDLDTMLANVDLSPAIPTQERGIIFADIKSLLETIANRNNLSTNAWENRVV